MSTTDVAFHNHIAMTVEVLVVQRRKIIADAIDLFASNRFG
jgi:hypothetical protein